MTRKEHSNSSSPQRRSVASRVPSPVRYGVATLAATAALGWGLGCWHENDAVGVTQWYGAPWADWDARREEVKGAFVTSWEAYSQYAWGELRLLSSEQASKQAVL
jgi:mannosyl-oligosaccharide alpha-1,2-mannosidase